eukprot:scaffold71141_cov65-Phaeocystis_antarctica.AAC.1
MGENKNLLKTNRPRIMNHINRLNNYVISEIANITVRSELNEEALVIFEKAELLVDYVSSIEIATESAERIDEAEVCVVLGKVRQLINEAMQCPSSRPAPRCDQEVLVDYVSSIETDTESAERIDEDEVCVMLEKIVLCSAAPSLARTSTCWRPTSR